MKSSKYQRRFYREWVHQNDLCQTHIILKETDLEILTDKSLDTAFLKSRVEHYRWGIEDYISRDRNFLVSLKPINVELDAPPIIKDMSRAAHKANVGPMAAVAGAIAKSLGQDLLKIGYKDVIVENGGDIFIKTRRRRRIAIYAGRQKAWRGLSLRVRPKDTPLGVCTSSGTVGHSLSLGCADSVTVLSRDAALADAVATAAGNQVQSNSDLEKAVSFARSVEGITGVIIIKGKRMASWGKIEFAA